MGERGGERIKWPVSINRGRVCGRVKGHVLQDCFHGIGNILILVIADADDQGLFFSNRKPRWIISGIPSRAEDIKLGELLALLHEYNNVENGADSGDNCDNENDGKRPVHAGLAGLKELLLHPCRYLTERDEKPLFGREEQAAVLGDDHHRGGKENKRHDNRVEPDPLMGEVEKKPDQGDDCDREAEGEGESLDPGQIFLPWEEGGDQDIAGDKEDHREGKDDSQEGLVEDRNIDEEDGDYQPEGDDDQVLCNGFRTECIRDPAS